MNNLYNEMVSSIRPSDNFEERILNATVNKKVKAMTYSAKVIISAAVVLAVLLGGMITVSAVTGSSPYEAISSFFAVSTEEMTEELTTGEEPTEPTEPAEETSTEPLTEVSEWHTETLTEETTRKQNVNEQKYYNEWVEDNSTWYYYGADGKKLTDWQKINGDWYYFYRDGKLAVNTYIGSRYVDIGGRWLEDYSEANYKPAYSDSGDTGGNSSNNSQSPEEYAKNNVESIVITKDNKTIKVENAETVQRIVNICLKNSERASVPFSPSSKITYKIVFYVKDGTQRNIFVYYDETSGKPYANYGNAVLKIDNEELDKIWLQINK